MNVAPVLSMKILVDAYDLVRSGNGQQLQGNSVQYGENPCVHPDSQRNCENRHCREPGILRQRSRSIAEIAPGRLERNEGPGFSTSLFDVRHISKLPPRREA